MKRLLWLSTNVLIYGLVTKFLSTFTGLSAQDILISFIFVKIADIQFRLDKE